MSQRDVHKAGMRDAKDDAKRSYHDQMQYAVKILMNHSCSIASGFYRLHRQLGNQLPLGS